MKVQCVERDGARIYEWRDLSRQGWWLQAGESAEARRFFPEDALKQGQGHAEMTRWLQECREYRQRAVEKADSVLQTSPPQS